MATFMEMDFYTAAAVDPTHLPKRILITVGENKVLLDEASYLSSCARHGAIHVTLLQAPRRIHL
ncbi:hypothetical protein BDC45DRAFT_564716 [Circinella umbellata]|nr:hypothetical protein BDC45DRAFT_564716 [Circinella umbellata]